MAQTGYTPISLYYSSTATNVPTNTNLANGELAINTNDGKLFYKDSSGVVQVLATKGGVGSSTTTQVLYNSSGSLAGSANMTFNGTTLTLANDASISGLTVGKGASAVARNTVVGSGALGANTTGNQNVAIGYSALQSNTSASENTAVGDQALTTTTTGEQNVAVGRLALNSTTTGSYNVALGKSALQSNTTASNNTAVGYQAGYSNQTGASNVYMGRLAGYSDTVSNNTFIGQSSGYWNQTGTYNVALGASAYTGNLATLASGSYNISIGAQTLYNNSTGASNTAIGHQALNANTTASNNTAVGYQAGYANTTASYNVALGGYALASNTTASANTAVGYQAAYSNTTNATIDAFGYRSLYNSTGTNNVAFGCQSLTSTTSGSSNVAMGAQSLYSNTTGSNNTAVGYQAGYSGTTGADNTFVGKNAGYSKTTSNQNTFIGSNAGYYVTTGANNSILGIYNGNQGGLDIRTASNYIVLSDGDGNPRGYFDNSGTFITGQVGAINSGITLTSVYGTSTYRTSNNANYGIHSFYSDYGSTQSQRAYFSGNGGLANYSANNANLSDERMKKDISLAGNYLDKICSIPVKTFLYTDQEDEALNLGVIAQDVQAVAPELICTDGFGEVKAPDGSELLTVYETDLMYALMKSIQELKAEVDSLKQQLGK